MAATYPKVSWKKIINKLNFHQDLQFPRFQANFLTCKFPFLLTLAQLLCPSNGLLQFTLSFSFSHTHFLHPNTNFFISNGMLALDITWPKKVPLNGEGNCSNSQDTTFVNA
jgi:hypothetical protein